MGNSSSKFDEQQLQDTDHLLPAKCIDGKVPHNTSVKITMTAEDWKCRSSIISVCGDVTAKLTLISSWNKEGAIVDMSGDRLCVTKGKMTGFGSRESLVLRLNKAYDNQKDPKFACDDEVKASPLFEFAKVSVQDGIMNGEGQYALVTADGPEPIYVGKRLTGITQRIVIFDMNGQCIAKVQPTDYWKSGKECQYDIAAGVDRYAIIALASCLFSGGGGANAGSGTGAFGG